MTIFVTLISVAAAAYTWWQLDPSRMERLGRNAAVGMRSSAIMRSGDTWKAGHEAAWPRARQAAIVLFVGSLVSSVVLPYTRFYTLSVLVSYKVKP